MGINPTLQVGDSAPDFQARATIGTDFHEEDVQLSKLFGEGRGVVLYFYPKDSTPGCTTQACDFRDHRAAFESKGFSIFGVSPDSLQSHAKFQTKHTFSFGLISDPDHAIAEAYGVWREKKNYGKTYMGIVRSTFVIGAEGIVQAIHDNVRAKGHVERLLESL